LCKIGNLGQASMSTKPRRVAADMWLRLAARSPFHDNSSLRRRIEANMTAAQLDEAQTRPAAWQPHLVQEVLAMTIDLPAAAGAQRPWSPGLRGGALDRFKEAATIRRSGSDCPTLRQARRSGPRSPRSRHPATATATNGAPTTVVRNLITRRRR
jgi:hypothetical protein